MRSLDLLLPGLLGPVSDAAAVEALVPELPALARLLSRADASPVAGGDLEGEVLRAFGVSGPPWPVAAAARAGEGDGVQPGDRWWLRVDPVHLRIDMTHARLFGAWMLDPTPAESEALVETLNRHFAEDGLVFEAPAPRRWYVAFDQARDLATHSPTEVAGRNVDHFLPGGADGAYWRGLLNEVQMLLHEHPVNTAREAGGHLPVNSVWPWGGGFVPAPGQAPDHVLADEPLSRGLAALAGSAAAPLPASLAADAGGDPLPDGRVLVVDDSAQEPLVHGEAEAWLEALHTLEQRWCAPALERLRGGELDRVTLRTGGPVRYSATRRSLRLRFWRRTYNWTHWLEPEP